MSRKTNRPRREMEERRMVRVKMMVMSAQATR
jgi:hypothetical protein